MGVKDDLPAAAHISGLYEKEAFEIGKAKKLTTTALGRLGAEHKLLQELVDFLFLFISNDTLKIFVKLL